MNPTSHTLSRAVLIAVLHIASGQSHAMEPTARQALPVTKMVCTERISDKQLRGLQGAKPPTVITTPKVVSRTYDIIEMSDFIVFDGISTLVPKGAILNAPKNLQSNIAVKPQGELVLWNDFLTRNRARVVPLEITIEEAAGRKPVDPKRLASAANNGRFVVAVIHGNPTSVTLPPSITSTTNR